MPLEPRRQEPLVYLHPEYGLNPTIPTCFFCGESKNEIVLLGIKSKAITGSEEAPMRGPVFDHEPCDKCAELMKRGILLISVRDGESGNNPYRTGRLCVIREEAFKRIFFGLPCENALKCRFAFVEDAVWRAIGLP